MTPRLCNLPVFKDDDIICVLDRREAMRYHEDCAIVAKSGECLLDILLSHCVQSSCSFVEDHNWRILELWYGRGKESREDAAERRGGGVGAHQTSGDRHSLLLSSAETQSSLPHLCLPLFGEPFNESLDLRHLRSLLDLRERRILPGIADIVEDRVVEQSCVLWHDPNASSQTLLSAVSYVTVSNANDSTLRIIKPKQQSGDRCLATSCWTHDS
jgi:hypothetical protein